MTDRLTELMGLLHAEGADAVRRLIDDELRQAPPSISATTQDAVMQRYGDRPDVDVTDD